MKIIKGKIDRPGRLLFSQSPEPGKYERMNSISLGHPKIVSFVIWILKKLGAK